MIEIIVGLILLVFLSKDKKENYSNSLKNIYGTELESCQIYNGDGSGSWDNEGKCSELGGGVHQICFKLNNNTKDFSSHTGQSNWSQKNRLEDMNKTNNQHCMCLGAWSLYKAKQEKNQIQNTEEELVCNAIPEIALSANYINSWSKWNGIELPNQIVNGVNSLVKQCHQKENDNIKKNYLKQKYCNFANTSQSLKNSNLYTELCL